MPVASSRLLMGKEPLRHNQIQIIFRSGHRHIKKPSLLLDFFHRPVAISDGMQPSTTFRTRTAFHSCPFAEWIVDKTVYSSSRIGAPARPLVASGGSRVSSVRNFSRDL